MCNNNFDKWNREFRNQNLFAFNNDINALLWLKVRAISKKLPMEKFLKQNNIQLNSTKITEQNKELFEKLEVNIEQSLNMLDNYPAVGEIKSVDFFIDDIPVDLKVTFFPTQYMNDKLKAKLNGKSELSWLKQKAKENGIELSRAESLSVISEKIGASGHDEILQELRDKRKEVIADAQNNKNDLMTWLYANQGEMRFGAENRLFVVLVDSSDMSQSWKMKRAFEQIEPAVNSYLDNFTNESLSRIDFAFKGNNYSSLADVVFVVK